MSYIRVRRLEEVARLLGEAGDREPIGDLAYRFGFGDTSHPTRLFKATYGQTPSAYRAARRSGG